MPRCLALVLALLSSAAPALAARSRELPRIDSSISVSEWLPLSRTTCHGLVGWMDHSDPGARIVRAGPSFAAQEIGRISQPVETSEDTVAPKLRIVGSHDHWLEIEGAEFDPGKLESPSPATFSGRGWIMGEGLRVVVQAELGFARPSHRSPVLIDARPRGELAEFGPVTIVACQGRWILGDFAPAWLGTSEVRLLTYRPEAVVRAKPLALRAWVAGICNNGETSCDGLDGNRAETSRLDEEL